MAKRPAVNPAPRPVVQLKEDWTAQKLGRFLLAGTVAIEQWKTLSDDAKEGLKQRARMENVSNQNNRSLDGTKLHKLQGKAAGALELKLANPLTRGVAFKKGWGNADWYITWLSEGQHPSNSQTTKAGVESLRIQAALFGG